MELDETFKGSLGRIAVLHVEFIEDATRVGGL